MTAVAVRAACARAATAWLAVAAFACSPGSAPLPEALVFLQASSLLPPLAAGGGFLLAGRFEVTRGEYRRNASEEEAQLPEVFLSLSEASFWARARGLRLPSLAEWRHAASGGSALPEARWGAGARPGIANTLELGLGHALPVGVFERSRTALGGYDLRGNVWEWVRDPPAEDGLPARARACGGSYACSLEHSGGSAIRVLEEGEKAEDIGFRVFADAESYLRERILPRWREAVLRDSIRSAFAQWRPEFRAALAQRLAAGGVEESFCAALR